MVKMVISGGQTGVDRAALDVAITLNIPHGGYCPKGRKAEDGPLPNRYILTEIESSDYRVRTEKNVEAADATIIITNYPIRGGTSLTRSICIKTFKPFWTIYWSLTAGFGGEPPGALKAWLEGNKYQIVNVAGPRESKCPGIYAESVAFLKEVLKPGGK